MRHVDDEGGLLSTEVVHNWSRHEGSEWLSEVGKTSWKTNIFHDGVKNIAAILSPV